MSSHALQYTRTHEYWVGLRSFGNQRMKVLRCVCVLRFINQTIQLNCRGNFRPQREDNISPTLLFTFQPLPSKVRHKKVRNFHFVFGVFASNVVSKKVNSNYKNNICSTANEEQVISVNRFPLPVCACAMHTISCDFDLFFIYFCWLFPDGWWRQNKRCQT